MLVFRGVNQQKMSTCRVFFFGGGPYRTAEGFNDSNAPMTEAAYSSHSGSWCFCVFGRKGLVKKAHKNGDGKSSLGGEKGGVCLFFLGEGGRENGRSTHYI